MKFRHCVFQSRDSPRDQLCESMDSDFRNLLMTLPHVQIEMNGKWTTASNIVCFC